MNNTSIRDIVSIIKEVSPETTKNKLVKIIQTLKKNLGIEDKTTIKKIRREINEVERSLKRQEKINNEIISYSDLIKTKNNISYIVEKLIPKESIAIISGYPGSYKTWICLHIAISVTQGLLVFEKFSTEKTNILIIDEENSVSLLKNRLECLSDKKSLNIYFMVMNNFKATEENISNIKKIIKLKRIGFIIIDSFIRVLDGEENSAKDVSKTFNELRKITKYGASILITHHHRKGNEKQNNPNSLRGSSDILASIDSSFSVNKKDNNKIFIKQMKNRFSQEEAEFIINIEKEASLLKFKYARNLTTEDIEETRKNQIFKIIKEGGSVDIGFIYEKSSLGKNRTGVILKELEEEEKITITTKEKNKKYYSVSSL